LDGVGEMKAVWCTAELGDQQYIVAVYDSCMVGMCRICTTVLSYACVDVLKRFQCWYDTRMF
jgi:hypothetical protein